MLRIFLILFLICLSNLVSTKNLNNHFNNTNPPLSNNVVMAPVTFTNSTSLIPGGDHFSGVAMAISDMNGDGRDDIIRYSFAKTLSIQYQNAPGALFTNDIFGQVSGSNQWGTCIGDFDKNGFNDIMVGGAYDNLKVISNNNTTYSLTTLANSNIFLQGGNFADIDNDSWIDIFACHDDALSRAYRNQNGTFTYDPALIDTPTNPTSDNSGNYASMWTDYDNDGDLDMYLSKCRLGASSSTDPRRINMLFQNDGNNNYTEVGAAANLRIGAQTWLSDFGDIDNDGDMDVLVVNHHEDCNLMLNNGDGTFTNVFATSGLAPTLAGDNIFGIQGLFRDFDNDGHIDIIITGSQHAIFYNDGDGTFTEAANPFGANDIESLAVGDLNHDGFLDIYAGYANIFNSPSNIPDQLFMNDGNSNHFINIQLEGISSNVNGIGARVEAHGSWGTQIREVRSGEGYGIHNSFTVHFGLGQATAIDSIVVKWPSGIIQVIDDINSVDQFFQVCELSGMACNDNNPNTTNDTYDDTCNCLGTPFNPNSCSDGIMNGDETGIDCGGTLCAPCCNTSICSIGEEEASNYPIGADIVTSNPDEWIVFPGFNGATGYVSSTDIHCQSTSAFQIAQTNTTDLVYKIDYQNANEISVKFNILIPSGSGAFFASLSNLNQFSIMNQLILNAQGEITFNSTTIGNYTFDVWHQVEIIQTLANSDQKIYFDNNLILNNTTNAHVLSGVNFWGNYGDFYVDNICVNDLNPGCPPSLTLFNLNTEPVGTGWYATNYVDGYGVVNSDNQLYQAGNYVDLGVGFEVPLGIEFTADIGPCYQPANDVCGTATALTINTTCNPVFGSNQYATASTKPIAACGNLGNGNDNWYKVVIPLTGTVEIFVNTLNGPDDFVLEAYRGNCASLTTIACDDNSNTGLMPRLQITGELPNSTIYLRVFENGNDATGSFEICATN